MNLLWQTMGIGLAQALLLFIFAPLVAGMNNDEMAEAIKKHMN